MKQIFFSYIFFFFLTPLLLAQDKDILDHYGIYQNYPSVTKNPLMLSSINFFTGIGSSQNEFDLIFRLENNFFITERTKNFLYLNNGVRLIYQTVGTKKENNKLETFIAELPFYLSLNWKHFIQWQNGAGVGYIKRLQSISENYLEDTSKSFLFSSLIFYLSQRFAFQLELQKDFYFTAEKLGKPWIQKDDPTYYTSYRFLYRF